ncbi:MAG: aldose epimerase family protein [Rhizobiaceae bacterium]
MDGELFGTTAEGEPVHRFTISGGGLTARVMTWGAALQDLRLAGHDAPLVLGFDRFGDYEKHSPYFGATAGRFANRIGNARFTIDGRRSETDPNFLGRHTLHGGARGFGAKVWQVVLHGPDFVTLALHSPDGDMGFPGAIDVTCTYGLKIPGTLSIDFTGTSDETTLCNLAHHSYFNLEDGGSGTILDHRLAMPASAYLPVDDELIPTGIVLPVEGTPFDFRKARPIRLEEGGEQAIYDHNFCLSSSRGPLRQAAWAQAPQSGVEMEMWTTEPGVQFYAGHKVEREVPGLGGRSYRAWAGFCLEAQVWPDSPNQPHFPSAVLHPGDRYHQTTEYRFRMPA